ncbi:hypothetical protein VH1807_contig00053-0027 [Vibrio harveyi]|nr:hypothetical protein VH1807_contig00053-0027 [Vibrio harveyi]
MGAELESVKRRERGKGSVSFFDLTDCNKNKKARAMFALALSFLEKKSVMLLLGDRRDSCPIFLLDKVLCQLAPPRDGNWFLMV